jgi:hypothetical protein
MVGPSTRDKVLGDLVALDPITFVENHIFDRVPHCFGGNRVKYVAWKRKLAFSLGVDPADLTVVGSAAVGVSLNPHKNFQVFGVKSDIDVAVISSYYFQTAWRYLRQNGSVRSKLGVRERGSWDEHRSNLIFWGTVATDRLLSRFPFGAAWRAALDKIDAEGGLDNPVNVRVYSDYEALRSYQLQSVRTGQQHAISKVR